MTTTIDETIEDFLEVKINKEYIKIYYKECLDWDEYWRFDEDNDEFIDEFIKWIDFEYDDEVDDSAKLHIIIYIFQNVDNYYSDEYQHRNIADMISEGEWDRLLSKYVEMKMKDIFINRYKDTFIEYIFEFKEEEELEDREDLLKELAFKIAIKKILRSKIYNYGLGLKLNMRDAGITAVN